jgi:hypothetical protein
MATPIEINKIENESLIAAEALLLAAVDERESGCALNRV